MRKAPIALLFAAAAIVAAAWWMSRSTDDTPPPPPRDEQTAAAPDEPTPAVANAAEADAGRSHASATPAVRTGARPASELFPLPARDEGQWIDVHVVEAESKAAVADAEVRFYHMKQQDHVQRLPQAERAEIGFDSDRIAERFGWSDRTDEHGVVRVPIDGFVVVTAQHGSLYGTATFSDQRVEGERHVLELVPDVTVLVRVLTRERHPVAGIEVNLAPHDPEDKSQHLTWFGSVSARTDEHGLAALRHVQQWHKWPYGPRSGEDVAQWQITAGLSSGTDEAPGPEVARLAPSEVTDEPIELQLAAAGQLHVQVMLHGKPFAGEGVLNLKRNDKENRHDRLMTAPLDGAGRARFEHVPTGIALRLHGQSWHRDLAGPQVHGQIVRTTVELAELAIVAIGRILDPDGEPMPNAVLSAQGRLAGGDKRPGQHMWGELRTDAEARFVHVLAFNPSGAPRRIEQLRIEHQRHRGPKTSADIEPRAVNSGQNDLGDVQLDPGALMCSGRIECVAEKTPQVHLSVEHFDPTRDENERWRSPKQPVDVQVDDRTFEVRGDVDPGRYRLVVNSHMSLPAPPVEFVLGASDVVLALEAGTMVRGDVLLPDGMQPHALNARIEPRGSTELEQDRRDVWMWPAQNGKANLHAKELRVGSYTLSIRTCKDGPALFERDLDIDGSKPSIDLGEIDLREVQVVRITLELPPDVARRNWIGVFEVPPAGQPATGVYQQNREVVLPVSRTPTDVLLLGPHVRPVLLHGVTDTATARLEPWPEAALEFAPLPDLRGARLVVEAHAHTPDLRFSHLPKSLPHQWGTVEVDEHTPSHKTEARVKDGAAKLRLLDGANDLKVFVLAGDKRVELKGCSPRQLNGPGQYTVAVDIAELTRVLEANR